MIKKILVLEKLTPPYDQIPEAVEGILIIREPGTLESKKLLERLLGDPTIEGIICPLSQNIDEAILALPQIKVVGNVAVGLNNIDLHAAKRHHVVISHTPYVLTDATADLAWALLLGGSRRLIEGDHLVRSGAWKGWEMNQLLGQTLGKTSEKELQKAPRKLGIIGLGKIGEAIAKRAKGFNIDVIYYSRTRKRDLEKLHSWEYRELNSLIIDADFLVLATPLTNETRHILNKERIWLMKPSAYLVNIGRGPLIDEEALIEALKQGHLSGAGLDVYENEPYVPESLRSLPQVTLSPHLGSATTETRRMMSELALESTISCLQGKELRGYIYENK